jgi:hypothetical protein
MPSGHFAWDAYKSGMDSKKAEAAIAPSFLFDHGSLYLVLKSDKAS